MKRIMIIVISIFLLCGCEKNTDGIDQAMDLRSDLLNGTGCSFVAEIAADFGDKTYTFMLDCVSDQEGNVSFLVQKPEYIEGICGEISYENGKLTFDDIVLAFDLKTEDCLSPVSGPWILVKALREGYIRSCTKENNLFRITLNDSYQEDALLLDIWFNLSGLPISADIYEENCRIMVIKLHDFKIL